MAVSDQVLHGPAGTTPVVGADQVDPGEVVDLEIQQHHRRAPTDLLGDHGVFATGRDDDESVDPPSDQPLEDGVAAFARAIGASGYDDVAPVPGDVLEAAVDRREERVGDVERDETDRRTSGAVSPQQLGAMVGTVAEGGDRGADAISDHVTHGALVVDNPRDRLHAHAGGGGHVAHRRSPLHEGSSRSMG